LGHSGALHFIAAIDWVLADLSPNAKISIPGCRRGATISQIVITARTPLKKPIRSSTSRIGLKLVFEHLDFGHLFTARRHSVNVRSDGFQLVRDCCISSWQPS
jgi:hypothetical protein